MKAFKIIELKKPIESLCYSSLASELWPKIMSLRYEGYKQIYSKNVFPFGVDDMASDYFAICRDNGSSFDPLATFKIITKKTCEYYKFNLPALDNIKGNKNLESKLLPILNRGDDHFGYLGAFTILSKNLSSKEKSTLRNYVSLSIVRIITDNILHGFVSTVSEKSGAHKYAHYLGLSYLSKGPIEIAALDYTGGYLMHMEKPSERAISDSEYLSEEWENRIKIVNSFDEGEKKKIGPFAA